MAAAQPSSPRAIHAPHSAAFHHGPTLTLTLTLTLALTLTLNLTLC